MFDRGKRCDVRRGGATATLLFAYHRRGDRSVRARVIEQGLPLVHSLARRFPRASVPLEDGGPSQEETSEACALVRTALGALSARERRIVALRFFGDWSQQTIATEVGLSQGQVSRVLSASLAKMRARLEVG